MMPKKYLAVIFLGMGNNYISLCLQKKHHIYTFSSDVLVLVVMPSKLLSIFRTGSLS